MEQLVEIEVIEFLLVTASTNVNWEGSPTDVEREKPYYNCRSLELILIVSIKLVRVSLIFFSVNATFSSLSVSFLDMFVVSMFSACSCLVENKYKTHV